VVKEQSGDLPGERTGEFLLQSRGITRIAGQNFAPGDSDAMPSNLWTRALHSGSSSDHIAARRSSYEGLTLEQFEQVLQATRDILVQEGLEGLTLVRVARLAHLSPASTDVLQGHFADGGALCADLFERIHQPLLEDLSDAAVGAESVIGSLLTLGLRWIGHVRQDVPLYLAYLDLARRFPSPHLTPGLSETIRELDRNQLAILAGLIAEGQMQEEVREGEPEVMAHAILACYYGMLATVSNGPRFVEEGIYIDDVAVETFTLMVRGLRA
jgi:AcrR family transcriptional regulator